MLWSHPLGTRAIPIDEAQDGAVASDGDVLPFESQSVRFVGVYPAGTPVLDIVDIGERNRVRCTIDGNRVTTLKGALAEDDEGAVHASTQL